MSASQHPAVAAADLDSEQAHRFPTPARTYARSLAHPVFATVDERVSYIRELMAKRTWTPETTGDLQEALAKKWGLSESTIRGYSNTASRMIRDVARDQSGPYALLALDTLAHIAEHAKNSPINGDKNAARGAAVDLLKFAGMVEPEEDKQRQGPLLQLQVGQFATSPAMQLVLGPPPPEFVLTTGEAVAEPTNSAAPQDGATQSSTETDGPAEEAGSVPEKFDWS